ncbi:uncharacterized protein N0V89_010827 [Didymosphaeria variabile]|uniref:Carboxylesterase type B domain-containing protein n=1 Tax=Didymosphaeria variabile TaxID=1932322 RepID=A0A9W9C6J5_9PLEO|nr:uncharacterized protein N0V89_010827 [Didymosphaeria variabile]KAJ4346894.1 hypothetical protein N0V89_010827 [Didymosphaeria variabile]
MDSLDTATLVLIETGQLSGIRFDSGTRAFLGIPYAAPPVSDQRWRPPKPANSWQGVRAATRFGPSSLQFPPPATSLYFGGESDFSEDCLYLNVYTGPEESNDRPILVWFHFGAFQMGSAMNPMYNGEKLAAEGITVVTVNYRLGVFGFLAHRWLSAESHLQASGNWGILDQIAALQWVQRNARALGGDPSNVTIGGVSAGGSSVHILRTSPLAKSLFCKALCESGPGIARDPDGHGHFATFTSLATAEEAGAELTNLLGASSINELREMPAQKLMMTQLPRSQGPWESDLFPGSSGLNLFDTRYPIVDGHVLPVPPMAAFLSGKVADIPLLAGNVGNEGSGLMQIRSLATYLEFMRGTFGNHADEALRLYPASSDAEASTSSAQLLSDQTFTYPVWTTVRLHARTLTSKVYYYQFHRSPPIPADSKVLERGYAGAFHGSATLYMFGNLDAWKWDWTDGDRELSRRMVQNTALFLKTGKPAQDGNIWPAVNSGKPDRTVMFHDEDCMSRLRRPSQRLQQVSAFWDRFYEFEHMC